MNITKKQKDELNLTLSIEITPEDYQAAEKKKLADRRRTTDLKGFRRGNAPASLIQRLFGERCLMEAVDDCLSEALDSAIRDGGLHILGQPLPSEEQPDFEWKSGNTFTFSYDLGLSPEMTFTASKEDKVPFYNINVTQEAKAELKKNMLSQFGQMEEGEATGEEDFIVADLDNGTHKVEGAYISLRSVAEGKKDVFLARKAGDSFDIDVNECFANETDRAALLKVKKEELAALNPAFKLTIVNVKTFVPATESQETYDKMYGEGVVKGAEEFDAKLEEQLKADYEREASYRFARDAREYFVKKADIALPEEFLKRWLISANEGKFTREDVEKEFEPFLSDFRWQLVRGQLMKQFDLKVEEKDLREAAEGYVAYQYAMYGMANVPPQFIKDGAENMLKDERQLRNLEEQVEDNKTYSALREAVTLTPKKISLDKFRALK